jgi:hypothetical protein
VCTWRQLFEHDSRWSYRRDADVRGWAQYAPGVKRPLGVRRVVRVRISRCPVLRACSRSKRFRLAHLASRSDREDAARSPEREPRSSRPASGLPGQGRLRAACLEAHEFGLSIRISEVSSISTIRSSAWSRLAQHRPGVKSYSSRTNNRSLHVRSGWPVIFGSAQNRAVENRTSTSR